MQHLETSKNWLFFSYWMKICFFCHEHWATSENDDKNKLIYLVYNKIANRNWNCLINRSLSNRKLNNVKNFYYTFSFRKIITYSDVSIFNKKNSTKSLFSNKSFVANALMDKAFNKKKIITKWNTCKKYAINCIM